MAPGFTDAGRLHGEIVIGHDIVRGLIAQIPDFPDEMAAQLRHIVISHHGEREKGSPVVPATREAVIVHYCDDMTARLAAVDEIAARTADGERWSALVNMLDGYTYLAEAVDAARPRSLWPRRRCRRIHDRRRAGRRGAARRRGGAARRRGDRRPDAAGDPARRSSRPSVVIKIVFAVIAGALALRLWISYARMRRR